jgi:hypothetical protein
MFRAPDLRIVTRAHAMFSISRVVMGIARPDLLRSSGAHLCAY